jgi:hypothetical protein
MFANFPCVAHFFHRNALSPRSIWPQNESNYGERLDAAPSGPSATALTTDHQPRNRRRYDVRRKISDALVPPKPNEFDSARLISRLRALCGTRSIGVSTDGLSRLSVGGTT